LFLVLLLMLMLLLLLLLLLLLIVASTGRHAPLSQVRDLVFRREGCGR
jgi:hypothetical protein